MEPETPRRRGCGALPLSLRHLRCRTGLRARLLLEDGTAVEGCGFGAAGVRVGEVVFTTSMTGYTEALTDPSYAGQILVWTHPMVGCYGVPSRSVRFCGVPVHYESDRIHVEGFVVSELPPPSHYLSVCTLDEWLRSEGVPGMYKVDARALVKLLRERGVMMGALAVFPEREEVGWSELERVLRKGLRYDDLNLALRVSPRSVVVHEPLGRPAATVAVLDCGLKYGILRQLLAHGFKVVRYPCWSRAWELLEDSDCVLLSNGPGNPELLKEQLDVVREVVFSGKPVLGICLGHQLAALALGGRTYKLRYGHRGPNKGVVDVLRGRCYITAQNHGYAVEEEGLEELGLTVWFRNVDDGTVEGLVHEKLPLLTVQFHPEGGPGPRDTSWVFELLRRAALLGGRQEGFGAWIRGR